MVEVIHLHDGVWLRPDDDDGLVIIPLKDVSTLVHDLLAAAGLELCVTTKVIGDPRYSEDIPPRVDSKVTLRR